MIDGLSPAECRDICQALRDGNIPPTGVGVLCVGRDRLVEGFRRFREASRDGSGTRTFIRAMGLREVISVASGVGDEYGLTAPHIVSADIRFNRLMMSTVAAGTIRTAGARAPELLRNWVRRIREDRSEYRDIFDTNSQLWTSHGKNLLL